MKKNKRLKIISIFKEHILNNSKEYIIVSLIFIIGIFLGVFFVNNMQEAQKMEIDTYLDNFIEKFKCIDSMDNTELLKENITQKLLLAVGIWFLGTTVIGIPIVFGIVLYRGFCFGYTISICVSILGISKGIIFVLTALLLQNILFIPALLALSVSGFKLYKSIIKDKEKDNIKIEILRHTIFSFIMLIVLIFSSIIETFISNNILKIIIKYF